MAASSSRRNCQRSDSRSAFPAERISALGFQGTDLTVSGSSYAVSRIVALAARLLATMDWEPVSVEQLARWTGLTAAELCSMLASLELAGRVSRLRGGWYQQREEGRSDERKRA